MSTQLKLGTSLNMIGDHFYLYSGIVQVFDTYIDLGAFTTDGYYYVGTLSYDSTAISSNICKYRVVLNGENAISWRATAAGDDKPAMAGRELIIPPHTAVLLQAHRATGVDTQYISCQFTGRKYDPER